MKLTKEEKYMFDALKGTSLGETMRKYLEKLVNDVCDSRTWGEHEDKTHSQKVASFITENMLNHLSDRKGTGNWDPEEYA